MKPQRNWDDAISKRDREGICRNCGDDWRKFPGRKLEFAHTAGREFDSPKPCPLCHGEGSLPDEVAGEYGFDFPIPWCPHCGGAGSLAPNVLWVNPDDGVPLCGPSTDTATCHGLQHAHRLELLPLLKKAEQLRLVEHLGSIGLAYRMTTYDPPIGRAA